MVDINFSSDATEPGHTVDLPVGSTLLAGALSCNFAGVVGECGGSCSCGTCHVHVDRQWLSRLEPASPEELDLLEFLDHYAANSRLSCQIVVNDELTGMTVRTPSAATAVEGD